MYTRSSLLLFCGLLSIHSPASAARAERRGPPAIASRRQSTKSTTPAKISPLSARPARLDLRLSRFAYTFLIDLVRRTQSGGLGNLREELAQRMKGIPQRYVPEASRLVERSLLAFVDQAKRARPEVGAEHWIDLPRARTASLEDDATERQHLPQPVETGREPVWRDTREANAKYMAAHRDERVVNASPEQRQTVLKQVRIESLGAQTVSAFERLGGVESVRLLNRGVPFATDETTPTYEQGPRPRSTAITDWGKYLFNAIEDVGYEGVIRPGEKQPPAGTHRAALYRMFETPVDFLAVHALVDGAFDRVAGDSAALKAKVQAHVRSLPGRDRELFTLYAELGRLASDGTSRTTEQAQAQDVELLRGLKAALGQGAQRLVILPGKASSKRSTTEPTGYTKALVVNASRTPWDKLVYYQGTKKEPWSED